MNLVKEFLLLKAKVDKLYCQLIANTSAEQNSSVPNHVKNIKQEDIDNWNKVEDAEVQITEDTDFAQIGQSQKDFNKSVANYKTNSDLKNQGQDNRLSDIEGKNIAQNNLINDLSSEILNFSQSLQDEQSARVNADLLKQDKLSSYDESILIENNGNIEGNISLFEEYFEQQECELNFVPTQIIGVYQDGIRLSSSEYEIILPKKIKIKEYVDENIQIEYIHLKS